MRLSQMLFVTLREDPAEAEIPSHKPAARRLYSSHRWYLCLFAPNVACCKKSPKLWEEMNATGAQECLQLQPAELWRESGRWDTYTQAEGIMFALTDRQKRELGPHEEVITTIARDMILLSAVAPSPLQIQTKFRDEIRPRFGCEGANSS